MEALLSKIIENLAQAESFEDAAEATLGTAAEIVRQAILSSTYAKNARVLRVVLHHRPDDGYRRLSSVDISEDGTRSPVKLGDSAAIASASAWQWARGHESAAAIDLLTGTVVLSSGGRTSSGSKGRISIKPIQRDATHLFVAPIRAPGHRMDGMLAVEAHCPPASGTPFVWDACRDSLLLLAAIAAPYLVRLPITRIERVAPNERLPVIGQSMFSTVEMLRAFAKRDEALLLVGPRGAGKVSLARFCHSGSSTKSGPFEAIRLADIPDEAQLAELFGTRKQPYSGQALPGSNGASHSFGGGAGPGNGTASPKEITGCIQRADKGTLFIDECERLTPAAQSALLRFLEERRYRVGGDGEERSATVRVMFGTSSDLKKLVDDGKLRADLFYRMDVLPLRIAPLRERPDEIVEWAEYLLRRRHVAAGFTSEVTLTQDAASRVVKHDWPGNLRQLEGVIRRAYALAQLEGSASEGVALRAEHIERALQYEGKDSPRTLLDSLGIAAEAFVAEAERRTENGARLDMDLADSFKGLVIEAAKRRWGPEDKDAVKKAFLLLGKEATVKSRNHWATYERELDKVHELRRVLTAADRSVKVVPADHPGPRPSAPSHGQEARHA